MSANARSVRMNANERKNRMKKKGKNAIIKIPLFPPLYIWREVLFGGTKEDETGGSLNDWWIISVKLQW